MIKLHTNDASQNRNWRLPADQLEKQICGTITNYLLTAYKNDLLVNPTAEELSTAKELLSQITQPPLEQW